jgi:N utilization substance protein B
MTGKTNPTAARRAAARLAAVQALYQMEMTGTSPDEALKDSQDRRSEEPRGRMAEPDAALLGLLVRGATQDCAELDEMVGNALTVDWPVERLESVLRAILRSGAWELKARAQTPARVVISEYVDVAHAFYSGPEPGLVNAVLDRIAKVLRPEEFQ